MERTVNKTKIINYNGLSYYYGKFIWFFLVLLNVLGIMILSGKELGEQTISLLAALPGGFVLFVQILLALLSAAVLLLNFAFPKYERLYKNLTVLNIVLLFALLVEVFFLYLISIGLDASSIEEMPKGFLESMAYMLVKSSAIWINGILGTLKLALLGTLIGFGMAILLTFLRIQTPSKRDKSFKQLLRLIGTSFARVYVAVVRGTPMMVQVLIIYYAGFKICRLYMPDAAISEINVIWSFFVAGLITVSLNTTAYLSEVLRGAIEALDSGQSEAARSLGLSSWQAMKKVIFPQAVKNSIPAIGNEFIINIKDTAVFNIIGVSELMFASATVSGIYFKQLEVYCTSALIYLILTMSMTRLLAFISNRMGMPQTRGLPSSN